jgi:hypothetical protein
VAELTPVVRPNGKLYRPRAITANAVCDENDALSGVVVLGTRDVDAAQPLADSYARWQLGCPTYAAASPEAGWWRDSFSDGVRCWVSDEVRGRAGVFFHEIEEGDNR